MANDNDRHPDWIPLSHCMQLYCEPYFKAVDRWRGSRNIQLLANRINALDTIEQLLRDYSQRFTAGVSYDFDLVYESSRLPIASQHFFSTVISSAGTLYHPHGDLIAINSAKAAFFSSNTVQSSSPSFSSLLSWLFNMIGSFFQKNLLIQLSGQNDEYLISANLSNRTAVISLLEKLFQISNDAGNIRFVYRKRKHSEETYKAPPTTEELSNDVISDNESEESDEEDNETGFHRIQTSSFQQFAFYPLSEKALNFLTVLIESQYDNYSPKSPLSAAVVPPPSISSTVQSSSSLESNVNDTVDSFIENQRDTRELMVERKENRRSINRPYVTEHLQQNGFGGNPSCSFNEEDDSHNGIDGVSDAPFIPATRLSLSSEWLSSGHHSIGTLVAAFFHVGRRRIYRGIVSHYLPPSSSSSSKSTNPHKGGRGKKNRKGDQLYHVIWEDGDEEDYDERQYNAGIAFYQQNFERKNDSFSSCVSDATENSGIRKNLKELKTSDQSILISSSSPNSENGRSCQSVFLVETEKDGYFQDDSCLASVGGKRKIKNEPVIRKKRTSTSSSVLPTEPTSETWITDHASVATSVAAFFPIDKTGKRKALFRGKVTRFSPETSKDASNQLYHVCWDDGDEEDYSEGEYQKAVLLYHDQYEKSESREKERKEKEDGEDQGANQVVRKGSKATDIVKHGKNEKTKKIGDNQLKSRAVFNVFHYGFLRDEMSSPEEKESQQLLLDEQDVVKKNTQKIDTMDFNVSQKAKIIQDTVATEDLTNVLALPRQDAQQRNYEERIINVEIEDSENTGYFSMEKQ
jgi:hypothetical protein